MTTRIEELEKEHEKLLDKLEFAVLRREYMEKKIFDLQYVNTTIHNNAIKDIEESIDRDFMDAVKKYAAKNPKRVGGL